MYTHALESTYQLVQQSKIKTNMNKAVNPCFRPPDYEEMN